MTILMSESGRATASLTQGFNPVGILRGLFRVDIFLFRFVRQTAANHESVVEIVLGASYPPVTHHTPLEAGLGSRGARKQQMDY